MWQGLDGVAVATLVVPVDPSPTASYTCSYQPRRTAAVVCWRTCPPAVVSEVKDDSRGDDADED
jgi:hypothetical protein